jgi:hypothetical protein
VPNFAMQRWFGRLATIGVATKRILSDGTTDHVNIFVEWSAGYYGCHYTAQSVLLVISLPLRQKLWVSRAPVSPVQPGMDSFHFSRMSLSGGFSVGPRAVSKDNGPGSPFRSPVAPPERGAAADRGRDS